MGEVGVLGPVVFTDQEGRSVKLGGERPRAVLAYLALHARRIVAVPELIDAVWGEEPPETAVNTLQVHVSALRKVISSAGVGIERISGGYRLDLPPDQVDAHRFEGLVAEGRAALRRNQAERAHELLTRGLALWRGRPFDGLDEVAFVAAARPAIENVWSSASVEQVECLIELRRFDEAIVAAELLVAVSPFDERAWAAAMEGYYWAGRATDALAAFRRARTILGDELGLLPGPELVGLERAVLDHTMEPRGAAVPSLAASASTQRLPATQSLVGRDVLVERVVGMLRDGTRLVSLVGLGGVGKTSLATAVAHRLSDADLAVWFVDLAGANDVGAAADTITRAVGAEAAADPLDGLRRWADEHRGVVVIDNLEQINDVGSLVTSLLHGAELVQLLATSRIPVRVRGEHLVPVQPLPITGDDGSDGDAVELFRRRAEQVRPDLELIDSVTVSAICDVVAGIPLGIELAAVQLRGMTPARLLERLRGFESAALDVRGTDDLPERQRTLRAVLDSTMGLLSGPARVLLARLSSVDGPVTTDLAAALMTTGVESFAALADLTETGLVNRLADADRLRVPVPVRQYVTDHLDDRERMAVADDLFRAVADLVSAADGQWYGPDAELHRGRLSADGAALDAAIAAQTSQGEWERVAQLAIGLAPYWLQQSRLLDALATFDALRAAGLDGELDVRARVMTGTFASYVSRPDTAELLESALAEFASLGLTPDRLVVNGWCCLGSFYAHVGRNDDVRRCTELAATSAAASGDATLVALARDFAGHAASYLGDTETTLRLMLEGIDDARRSGDQHALVVLLASATEALLVSGRVDEADVLITEAFDRVRTLDLGMALGWVLLMMGATQLELGRTAAARGSLVEQLRFTIDRYPDPLVLGDSLSHLAGVCAANGDDETAARAWGASAALHSDHGVDPDRRRLPTIQRRWQATSQRVGADRFDALLLAGSVAVDQIIENFLA